LNLRLFFWLLILEGFFSWDIYSHSFQEIDFYLARFGYYYFYYKSISVFLIFANFRVQHSQQQQNSRIPSSYFSSNPSSSTNNYNQKHRIEFNHYVHNNQKFVQTSEEKNSSNKNWAVKTSLLNRLRLRTAVTCEGKRNNISGSDKEKLERNETKKVINFLNLSFPFDQIFLRSF
jgi:hypothetical protein